MEAITVNFKLSEKEYLDAARLIVQRPKPSDWKFRAALSCGMFPFGFFALALGAGFELPFALALAFALFPVFVYLYFFHLNVMARRFYKGDRKFREGMSYTFTDEYIMVQSKLIESKQNWKLYTDVLESENCYALIYGNDIRMAAMIPKRAFKSKKQHMTFRELIGAQFNRAMPVRQVGEIESAEREYQPASLEPPDWR
ncbi:MAG TPA: YcxB family protein [Pyrinomonadaceae bacterium]|jgi:hypothetical protein|nr:YcxB family protein [Pyrinomonadaceae bacterium]